ncbi:MAG: acyl-CoA carboxylase subunit epsilon [Actinomycetota bacterium]|nr:acyl-CoA carboxylase subunit epsilon [Actinomycetota bacterium]
MRGHPSAEEVAVLTAITANPGAATGQTGAGTALGARWADPAHMHRRPRRAGPGAWAASRRWS